MLKSTPCGSGKAQPRLRRTLPTGKSRIGSGLTDVRGLPSISGSAHRTHLTNRFTSRLQSLVLATRRSSLRSRSPTLVSTTSRHPHPVRHPLLRHLRPCRLLLQQNANWRRCLRVTRLMRSTSRNSRSINNALLMTSTVPVSTRKKRRPICACPPRVALPFSIEDFIFYLPLPLRSPG